MYDRAFFDRPIDRRGTACEKWDVAMARDARVSNPMWVADMDFRCPDEVVNALCERAAHPVYGYTEQTDRAVAAMLDFMERRHGLKLTPSEQIMLPCVVSGMKAAVQAFTQPGDRIIVQPPVYGPFYASARDNGREVAECPLRRDDAGRYTMDLQSVEDACRAGARMMFLCSPHNPVGRVWSREELKALFAVLARYDVLLVSDEIHEDFVYRPGVLVPALDLAVEAGVRAISMTSASKTFNLAGLQVSNIWIPGEAARARFQAELGRSGYGPLNTLGLVACQAAYREGGPWLDQCKAYLRENLAFLRTFLAQRLPEIKLVEPEGTYFAWLDCTGLGMDRRALNDCIIHRARLWLDAGHIFGAEAELFQRIVLACPRATLEQALVQLERAVRGE